MDFLLYLSFLCLIESTLHSKWKPIKIRERPYVVAIKSWLSDVELLRACYKEKRFLTKREYNNIRAKITEEKLVAIQTGTLISLQTVVTSASIYYNWQTLQIPFKYRNKTSIKPKDFNDVKNIIELFWQKMFVVAGTEINIENESSLRTPWRQILDLSVPNISLVALYPELYNIALLSIEPFVMWSSIQVIKNVKWYNAASRNVQWCETVGYDSEKNVLVRKELNVLKFNDTEHKPCVSTVTGNKLYTKKFNRVFCTEEQIIVEGLDSLGFYGAPLLCNINGDRTLTLVGIAASGNVRGSLFLGLNYVAKLIDAERKLVEEAASNFHKQSNESSVDLDGNLDFPNASNVLHLRNSGTTKSPHFPDDFTRIGNNGGCEIYHVILYLRFISCTFFVTQNALY